MTKPYEYLEIKTWPIWEQSPPWLFGQFLSLHKRFNPTSHTLSRRTLEMHSVKIMCSIENSWLTHFICGLKFISWSNRACNTWRNISNNHLKVPRNVADVVLSHTMMYVSKLHSVQLQEKRTTMKLSNQGLYIPKIVTCFCGSNMENQKIYIGWSALDDQCSVFWVSNLETYPFANL